MIARFLLVAGLAILLLMIVRFVQPEVIYALREALAGVRKNRLHLENDENERPDREESKIALAELMVLDLRPEGVPRSIKDVLARVTKIRELYSILDLRRERIRNLPRAQRSHICVVELANIVEALARDLNPSAEISHSKLQADEILSAVASSRQGELDGADEEEISVFYRENPISIEQINEMLIAIIYAITYRLEYEARLGVRESDVT